MPIIGREETVDLPDLDIHGIKARIDTGAYSSSLHCSSIELDAANGVLKVHFLTGIDEEDAIEHVFSDFRFKDVRSSNGITEKRYVIDTHLTIGEHNFKTIFTLADRSAMKFPMLIGRKAIYKKFLVNVARKNVLKKKKKAE